MDHSSETANLDQTDEEILSYTVSDEELEAAGDTERGAKSCCSSYVPRPCC
jgi:hypothetical protein